MTLFRDCLHVQMLLVLTIKYLIRDWSIEFVLISCSDFKNEGSLLKAIKKQNKKS